MQDADLGPDVFGAGVEDFVDVEHNITSFAWDCFVALFLAMTVLLFEIATPRFARLAMTMLLLEIATPRFARLAMTMFLFAAGRPLLRHASMKVAVRGQEAAPTATVTEAAPTLGYRSPF